MNVVLLSLLIVADSPVAPTENAGPGVTEVYGTTFDEQADRDYDRWPDHWTRRQGLGFPLFNKIHLCEESPPGGGRSLRMELEGGGAVAYSPPVPVSSLCDYVIEAYVKTEGLRHDRVFLSLGILDQGGKTLQTFSGEPVAGPQTWTRLRLGPVSPGNSESRSAILGLHVEPGVNEDLKGSAMFGGVSLGRLPRMTLAADEPMRLYTDSKRPAISCRVSGLEQPSGVVAFELTDARGSTFTRETQPLEDFAANGRAEEGSGSGKKGDGPQESGLFAGTASWRAPATGPGFYVVRASLEGHPSDLLCREITLAVIRPQRTPAGSRFGWSLPDGGSRLPLESLAPLLAQSGVGWVKYPLWIDATRQDSLSESLAAFFEQLSRSGITVVGTLDVPPKEVLARFDPARPPSAAEVFSEKPEVWYPSLEPVVLRFGTQVRWWQLGRDEDTSFVGYPDLKEKIGQVKKELDRVGYDLNVGMAWNWQNLLPSSDPGKTPWRFVSLTAQPPLTAQELAAYLPIARREQIRRWVTLKPLARGDYRPEDRAADLVQRMLAAKLHGAEGVFVPDPFHPGHGLMNEDGTPGDLFLPWRTAALVLGGAEPQGSICLPQGSANHLFVRGTDAVLVAWNRTPVEETLYLGDAVRQIDLWGHEEQPPGTDDGSRLRLGPLPAFVTGMSKPVALWRRGFVLAKDRIPSVFSERHVIRFEFKNTFDQPVTGNARLVASETWSMRPERFPFRLAPGETSRHELELSLSNNAVSGPHVLRAEFEFAGGRPHRFSVYRTIQVGLGEVRVEFATHVNQRGELEIQQRTINPGDYPIAFRCELFAPGRQRLSTQVVGQARSQDVRVYRFSNGRELIGKTLWLQARETQGPQVLNYRFIATE